MAARKSKPFCPICGVETSRLTSKYCSPSCSNKGRAKSQADRFWEKVKKGSKDSCWLWQASTYRNGYGQFGRGGRNAGNEVASRMAWILTYGEIPKGLNVLHTCDNPLCCNPEHLWLGTQANNLEDMWKKGRGRGPFSRTK